MATLALVSFTTMRGVGSADAPGPGAARVRENFATLPAVTTNAAVDGEIALVCNNSTTTAIACAIGTTPDGTSLRGSFPKPVMVGNKNMWVEAEVDQYIEN